MSETNRRNFLKYSVLAVSAVVLSPFEKAFSADAPLKPLSESDPVAVALGYHENAAKVDLKKWPKKAGPDGKTQTCKNCNFYTAIDGKRGKCQLFANGSVAVGGWCNSWMLKAAK